MVSLTPCPFQQQRGEHFPLGTHFTGGWVRSGTRVDVSEMSYLSLTGFETRIVLPVAEHRLLSSATVNWRQNEVTKHLSAKAGDWKPLTL